MSKVDIREVYRLIEALEVKINDRLDNLENNHLQHLSDRISSLETRVWFASGAVAVLLLVLKFLIK